MASQRDETPGGREHPVVDGFPVVNGYPVAGDSSAAAESADPEGRSARAESPSLVDPPAGAESPGWAESAAGAESPGRAESPGLAESPLIAEKPATGETAEARPEAAAGAPADGQPGGSDRAASARHGPIPAAALAEQQWPGIQALFVDDPRASVERAAAAAEQAVALFVASLQREQAALLATWQDDASTETLRTALQQYRALCGRVEGLG
jgi:hypothetical protein